MTIHHIIQQCKSIIALNGVISHFPNFLTTLMREKIVIAADGAAGMLIENGINIDYRIGDLDSSVLTEHPLVRNTIAVPDQNSTDFEKCMDFALQQNIIPSMIIGIGGGEIDHTINNLMSLCKHPLQKCFFLDINDRGCKIGMPLVVGVSHFTLPLHAKVSLIPMPHAKITTHGLVWDLQDSWLDMRGLISARNITKSSPIEVELIEGHAVIIMDYEIFDTHL
jgi:thiamine pyrophosphokinase